MNENYRWLSSSNGGAFVDRMYMYIVANANINGMNQTVEELSRKKAMH